MEVAADRLRDQVIVDALTGGPQSVCRWREGDRGGVGDQAQARGEERLEAEAASIAPRSRRACRNRGAFEERAEAERDEQRWSRRSQ